ncbi:shikimate kinase [Liquorilactobacillus aquaticus DSM 21051]|uniref:Shikimate kinase n=1 Tax=Liquorilactobacillus aquaticus DSM 21051 TaxID=1423725 RepID=A0A0R2CXS3_9LACO|nr:shikimate kinase [Liquorilactobacillus aquaticus]KRM96767.1 shikimate kinase [Liquorilactobacillus aquaticus DSM 21051]
MKAILIGFMGSGKTTIGKLLAEKLNLPHVDLDDQITAAAGIAITDIFSQHGENYFRQLEHEVLLNAISQEGILSTGGGTPTQSENLTALKKAEIPVILLEAAADTILERVSGDIERPLVNSLDRDGLTSLKEKRQPKYQACADLTIKTDGSSPEKIVTQILNYLNRQTD